MIETIKLTSIICTQRSYSDYVFNCKKILPDYFGFETIGILFRDQQDDYLFAYEDQQSDYDDLMRKMIEGKIKKGEKLTEAELKEDFQRQYKRRTWNKFSNSIGVTGQVFHTGEIIRENHMERLSNYTPSIDNRADCQDVHSIMIVPVYGHGKKMVSNGHGVQEAIQ